MMSSERISIAGLLVLLLACLFTVPAQWDKKSYTEWSERDAQKVLTDSPWARTQVFSDASQLFRGMPSGGPAAEVNRTSVPSATHINFRIRFLSAKPIRQAISRMTQLQEKKNPDAGRAEQLEAFAAGEFLEYIVVVVTCDSQEQGANIEEARSLLHRSGTAQLKNDTFLEIKGGRRLFLQEYQPPQSDGLGARFIFPRLVDGQPFITLESQEVRFYSQLSEGYRLDRRYKIKDMIYNEKLEY